MQKKKETSLKCPDCNSNNLVAFTEKIIITYYMIDKSEQKANIPTKTVTGKNGLECLNCGYLEFQNK